MRIITNTEPDSLLYDSISDNVYKVYFRENIENHKTYYSCDEYTLIIELNESEDVEKDITDNFDSYLEMAKFNDSKKKKENDIKYLKNTLSQTDYKTLKTLESYSLGLPLPYDYSSLVSERQAIRDEINNLQNENTTKEDILEQAKNRKINEMMSISQTTITNGIDYKGEHYRLNTTDQINLTSLYQMALNEMVVPYHPDGKVCRLYSPEEMVMLVESALVYITYQTTYFNLLKHQIMDLTTVEDVNKVFYGMELKEEYQQILDVITKQ